ncbi:MAG: hypothetical protein M4579_003035 [Chaenotheca gracillima]|nr:MAG: hypothetical protein M4579_003035 [Chaenotheca gracillima]
MGLIDKLQSKIEIYKLEQRYTRRRRRRTAFISEAHYVDGEYVHANDSNINTSVVAPSKSEAAVSHYPQRYRPQYRSSSVSPSPNRHSDSFIPHHRHRGAAPDDEPPPRPHRDYSSSSTPTAPLPASFTSSTSTTPTMAEKTRGRLVRIREIVTDRHAQPSASGAPSRHSTYNRDVLPGGGREREQVMMMGGVRPIGARV